MPLTAFAKKKKNSSISEDDSRDLQDEVQKVTDQFNKKIDDLLAVKEKDIMTV